MTVQSQVQSQASQSLPVYRSILVAVDSSDHANRGVREAVALAGHYQAELTGAHVYAAKLHDLRFRQMEGGLPEQFREEKELERQRDVHDDLITKGLSIITDSYLDQMQRQADDAGLALQRRSLEGKNYRELVGECNNGAYDLLVMGALGLGAVNGSRLGTVAQRVTRRSQIDTLVIKDPLLAVADGPIVVAVDGSPKSYGGLLTGLSLARAWDVPVKVVSAFDPYYHYVAFNRIAGVLSAEAGKVFKFQEQEKLHEEIIDSGLAKIYQGHLTVAQAIACDHGMQVETVLLDGKPHDVIHRYIRELRPSLLILGSTGIHADEGLDIGGNTEALLHDAGCAVLLSQRKHQPQIDRLASVSTSWTREAEARMQRVPSFVRSMAKMAILRYAQERGHTVITEDIVEEATSQLMPGHAEQAMEEIVDAYDRGELERKPDAEQAMRWHEEATRLLLTVKDLSLRGNLSMRAEKKARADGVRQVSAEHIAPFIDASVATAEFNPGAAAASLPGAAAPADTEEAPVEPDWQAAALARLMRVPAGFMRDSAKQRIEDYARKQGLAEVSLQTAEQGLAEARKAMADAMHDGPGMPGAATQDGQSACPVAGPSRAETPPAPASGVTWTAGARDMLQGVPVGFCREMTVNAAESIAAKSGVERVDEAFVSQVLDTIKNGSQAVEQGMPWDADASARLARVPEFVRGMLVREIEAWAGRNSRGEVDLAAVDAVKAQWQERGVFHLDPGDPRSRMPGD